MRTGLIPRALAAALTLLGAHARTLASRDPPDVASTATSVSRNDGSNPRAIVSSASVSCSATSFFNTFADLSKDYAAAIDRVVEVVCARDWDGNYTEAAEAMKNFTVPIGKVLAATKASCTTSIVGSGLAQGCANVEASAPDFSAALGKVHVAACEAAFADHCGCAKKWKWDFGDLEKFREIVSVAYADADVIACASGNETVTSEAFVECFATVVADTFAWHAAQSSVMGGCYRGYFDDKRRAAAEARAAELVLECKVTNSTTAVGEKAAKPKADPKPKDEPEPTRFEVLVERSQTVQGDGASATADGSGFVSSTTSGGSTVTKSVSVPE